MIKELKYKGIIGFYLARLLVFMNRVKNGYLLSDKKYISNRFSKSQGYEINWDNPQTLNEKLQVLKFVYNTKLHQTVSDKFKVREFITQKFGSEYLVPLVMETKFIDQITPESLPDFPIIIKANHDAGNYFIIRDKSKVNWQKLRVDCKWWLSWNYYKADREQQYKKIDRRIIVEKLLLTKDGKIPNDYKLNYINGELAFVYVSLDREGENFRNIYDNNWEPLNFKWANKYKINKTKRGPELPKPMTLEKMREIGAEIAKSFPYVRVDFYDVDGKLYIGEITLCHGGGFDKFEPLSIDEFYGRKLKINI
ncbi:MAG: ATP-grasp fold amidoligase family protein [Cloacibacterium sp.]|uniref:ATP-grasp fold amidoligase family protein n=1 Tax=Cloacibacterium sp. TaxID=1913682 RepID=UPI003C77035C